MILKSVRVPPWSSSRAVLHTAVWLLSSSALGCGDLELPPAPDMSELVQAYTSPDGELSTETAVDVGEQMLATFEHARGETPVELMGSLVDNLQELGGGPAEDPEGSGAGTQQVSGNRFDVAAVARLHHICRGWDPEAPLDEAESGSVDVTATLDSGGLIPVIWGSLNTCRVRRDDITLEVDGELSIRFGTTQARVGLRYLTYLGYLVRFQGDIFAQQGDQVSELTDLLTHFQVMPTGELRFLVTLTNGSSVVGVFDPEALDPAFGDPMLTVGVLAADTFWNCSISLADAHGSCSDSLDPDSVVSW